MPFLDDIGPGDERRSPTWATFATVADQVERMVMANLAWAAVLAPGVVALAFTGLPGWLRVVLGLVSATALPPATAVVYGVAASACRGQHVDLGLAAELLRELGVPSLRTLAPLYGTVGVLVWSAWAASAAGLTPLVTVLTLAVLVWSVCGTYWGPLFAADPSLPPTRLATLLVRLVWQAPERALLTWVVVGLCVLVGVVTIAGVALIVPVLVAVAQTHRLRDLHSVVSTPLAH